MSAHVRTHVCVCVFRYKHRDSPAFPLSHSADESEQRTAGGGWASRIGPSPLLLKRDKMDRNERMARR